MQPRQNNEAKLFPAIKRWAEERGFVVYAEVPWPCASGAAFDMAGVRWDTRAVVIVELKVCFTEHLLYQCRLATLIAGDVWAAVRSRPRPSSIEKARNAGIGVLRVVGDVCSALLEPAARPKRAPVVQLYRDKLLARLERFGQGHREIVGGLPTLKGDGPAQQVYDAIQRYRAEHPKATWRAIFGVVPNHYQDHKSL